MRNIAIRERNQIPKTHITNDPNLITYSPIMSLITVRICTGRSCSERHSVFIQKRLEGDRGFY